MKKFDHPLAFVVVFLALFGLVMISSVSIASSFKVTGGQNDFYFWKHFQYLLISIPCFFFFFRFPLEKLRNLSGVFFVFSLVLLLLTFVIGEDYGTAARLWLRIGSFSLQPVEILKLSIVVFLSALFSSGKMETYSFYGGFLPFVIVLSIPALILVIQSDFGPLFVITVVASVLFFVAGANLKYLLGGAISAFLLGLIVIFSVPYIKTRVAVFLNPELDPITTGYQVKQALIAIGSGGMFGRGFQNSIQKFDYLPEVQSDTIFSAISEEMGFFRVLILVLGAYLFLAYRGFFIAKNAPNLFSRYLAVGITTWIVGQAFVNIGVNLALLPNTGLTLPFLSYGGTSLILTLSALGILLQISSEVYTQKKRLYKI